MSKPITPVEFEDSEHKNLVKNGNNLHSLNNPLPIGNYSC